MARIGTALLTVGLVAGASYAAAEWLGPGDCGKEILMHHSMAGAVYACTGIDAREHADATITGPEKLQEKVLNTTMTMTFGEVALTERFPRDTETGKLSKLDWDPGGAKSCVGVCSTRFVKDTPFEVRYTPCVKTGDDYKNIQVGVDAKPTDPQSKFDIQIDTNAKTVLVKLGAIAACNVNIPTVDSAGNPNTIQEWTQDKSGIIVAASPVNSGVEQTFDYIHKDLALRAAPALACVGDMVDTDAIKEQISNWVIGAVGKISKEARDFTINIELGDQAAAKAAAQDAYTKAVEKYKALDKSLFPDSKGSYKGMKITFTNKGAQLAAGDCKGVVLSGPAVPKTTVSSAP